ncbi:DUF4185 domain-containing protein [Cesiribacter andamanensis]|uniref:DUF4185 domain-containing protein n=1 Tax=Cesiribacter andamanensis AMV16 TaxID=1279009 RepID=M7N176_9BACT|nr:DUF4185 domain-containing protein [Cesiribacter andamanensis]EMR00966.1 hypothetical protein ADICEAN_03908 [Cesiribacter andamanensis AMV16]
MNPFRPLYTPFALSLLVGLALGGCNSDATQQPDAQTQTPHNRTIAREGEFSIKAESVPQWEEMLRHTSGWLGADGVYAVALNGVERPGSVGDGETMFWFSDTIIGEIEDDSLKANWEMIHNSIGYMQGSEPDPEKIKFHWRTGEKGEAHSMFEPTTPNAKEGDYYWLGDGFFNHAADSTIYIFAYRIMNVPGGIYPFDDVGVSLIALPKGSRPPFENQRQLDTPLFFKDSRGRGKVVFGVSIMANTVGAGAPKPDGYIYVYGVRGPQKELLVARVPDREFENFGQWRYWDGRDWNADIHQAAALTSRVSNEMSVSFLEDGRVIAAYQLDTNSPTVAIQVGRSPVGPFQPMKEVYHTPEIYEDLDFYTYNAKAHPHLSAPGELLISYNVNSFDFIDDIHRHPHHLRPRFIRVKLAEERK